MKQCPDCGKGITAVARRCRSCHVRYVGFAAIPGSREKATAALLSKEPFDTWCEWCRQPMQAQYFTKRFCARPCRRKAQTFKEWQRERQAKEVYA